MTTDGPNYGGLHVLAFESRRAEETQRLIERYGGHAWVSPSMREVPLTSNPDVARFVNELLTGQVDMVIFTTGVGVRHLMAMVQTQVDRQRFLDSLSDIVTVARGPKPAAALRELGLTPTWTVPEPNTWRELLAMIDQHGSLANQTVAVQEYGKRNASLLAGLEARGAHVLNLQVYQWDLPTDVRPLEANIRRLAEGKADVVLFTSGQQVLNVLEVAARLDLEPAVRSGLRRAVVASVGPSTSEVLRQVGLSVDLEPSHPKLGHLVVESAERAEEILGRKRAIQQAIALPQPVRVLDPSAPWYDSPFMKACRREPTDVTPIWLMRQAGRYMEEYRRVRATTSFLDLCKNPQLCAEVMVTAVERLGVDAAIIFSDLLPILEPMGLDLEYAAGDGPIIHNPVRESRDIDRVIALDDVEELDFVLQTVRYTRRDLPPQLPLIGFAGAPFTLASYVIEGGASRHFTHTKTLMYRDGGAWRELMERIARSVTIYLNAQIAAGAQCVQLFDSWVGCLAVDDYRQYVLPYMQQIIAQMPREVPVISFATGNPALLPLMAEGGASVIGVDWRIELDDAWHQIGLQRAVQGNLDPGRLLADRDQIRQSAQRILDQAGGRAGHIFNLGHGILPPTPVENVIALVDYVHEASRR